MRPVGLVLPDEVMSFRDVRGATFQAGGVVVWRGEVVRDLIGGFAGEAEGMGWG